MQAQVASAASRADNEPTSISMGNKSSSENSTATFVEDMDIISPKVTFAPFPF